MAPRIPSLNWLRVFEAAARTESFARAAAQLNMSAAAVSQQVRALEEKLGTPLFNRLPHAVRLTEAGRAYLPVVQQSLVMLESATTGLFGASGEQKLLVQAVLIFAHGILAAGLPDFQARHPGISLSLSTGNSEQDFANRFTDLQIVFGNPRRYGAESDWLMGETLTPMAPPEIAAQIASPRDLLEFPLIEVGTHRAGWAYVLEELRVVPDRARYMFADSTIMAAAFAGQGLGIVLARRPASDPSTRAAGLVPCLPDVALPGQEEFHLVYPDRSALRPPARAFRSWLLDHVRGI